MMPYKHGQLNKRTGHHPVVHEIRKAGKAADKQSGGCAIIMIFVLCIPALLVLFAAYDAWVWS
jgi:hypothetical protein